MHGENGVPETPDWHPETRPAWCASRGGYCAAACQASPCLWLRNEEHLVRGEN